ncbi:AP-2 complex subunit alpha-2 [Hibiscus syriacus]|uniref:AP-2 complex subunit alpha-2 n=2 Tax=Magnoliopsida TaxID=3398 RepID=A0A6A2YGY9_HIBSY|nr:AP-2 complex subunit alpha-2 [Hibiscus syriacus]
MSMHGMRGLAIFISDIRNCQNKELERVRVDKELGNIRIRFKKEKGLTPYAKKKYVWKMLYIYMLGYDVDFGHMEAVSLISAPKYPEKQVGYIVTSCLLNENHDFLRLAINTVRNDIIGRNETSQCLALTLEVWEEISSSASDKAPGPDGFTMGFFKKYWPMLKEQIMKFVFDFYTGRKWDHGVNHAFISLIPKKLNPESLEDNMPISLVGSLYKIISKVLSKRLVSCIKDLVSPYQFAFIPGRQLLDCAFLANEGIDYWRKQGRKGVVFKIDFRRVYDTVEWPILLKVMKAMGFGEKWVSWIEYCLSSASISVLVNGSPTEEFPMTKGLRQGCSLSPLLFNLIGELLHLMVIKASDLGLFQGFDIGRSANPFLLTHLQFADDLILFCHDSLTNIHNFKRVLRIFSLMTGLHLNLSKSKLFGINVEDATLNEWANDIGCSVGCFPIDYLGLPIGAKKNSEVLWEPVLQNFNNKLAGWKAYSLLMAGRLLLIKSEDGLFLVKSCRVALSISQGVGFSWKRWVWSGLAPPRVETFLWKIIHKKLAVRNELKKRWVPMEDALRPLCKMNEETIQHLFFSCSVAGDIWNRMLKIWGIYTALPNDPHVLLSSWSDLNRKSNIWKFILGVVLWSIWKARNSVVFDNSSLDITSLFFLIRFRLARWFLAKFPNIQIQVDLLVGDSSLADRFGYQNTHRSSKQSWQPPPIDFYKFNVDGAVKFDGMEGGIGGILRDCNSIILSTFSVSIGPGPPLLAKLKAIKKGLDVFLSSDWALSSSCRPLVRKKAALCLLRLFKKNPDVVNVDGWADRMAQLLDERDLGVLTASMSLLVSLVSNNHEAYWTCLPKCVKILERLAKNQDVPQEYTYYGIPSPWLQVKTMRALQYFPTIEDPNTRRTLFEVLQRILMGTDVVKNVNKNNASHAVLFEALALVMHLDAEKEMLSQCVALLGKFIAVREPNIRYLGLENMSRMLIVADVQEIIKRHQAQIITSLKDPDIRRALDLLYGMCDVTNARTLLKNVAGAKYLSSADFKMREELSLKAAILAEKFAPDLSWYVDVILQLIEKAGDFISDDIWFRVVQFVTNNDDLQTYAAAKAKEYLDKPAVHEKMVKVRIIYSSLFQDEFAGMETVCHLLARRPGCSPKEIFSIIHEKLPTVRTTTIPILLSAYAKILMHTQPPDQVLQNQIWAIFTKYESCIDAEIQQRAVEYFALSRKGDALMDILAEMPKFPERQSSLIKKAEDAEGDTAEQSAIKLRAQQQPSNALVVTKHPANGAPPPVSVGQLSVVKAPTMDNTEDHNSVEQAPQDNVNISKVDPQAPSANLLSDLLGPLAIEGPPGAAFQYEHNAALGWDSSPDASAIVPVGEETNTIQPIVNIDERFCALCLKDSGILYEDPYIQCCLIRLLPAGRCRRPPSAAAVSRPPPHSDHRLTPLFPRMVVCSRQLRGFDSAGAVAASSVRPPIVPPSSTRSSHLPLEPDCRVAAGDFPWRNAVPRGSLLKKSGSAGAASSSYSGKDNRKIENEKERTRLRKPQRSFYQTLVGRIETVCPTAPLTDTLLQPNQQNSGSFSARSGESPLSSSPLKKCSQEAKHSNGKLSFVHATPTLPVANVDHGGAKEIYSKGYSDAKFSEVEIFVLGSERIVTRFFIETFQKIHWKKLDPYLAHMVKLLMPSSQKKKLEWDKLHVLSNCLVGWCKNFIKIGNLANQIQAKGLAGFTLMRVEGVVDADKLMCCLTVLWGGARTLSRLDEKLETLAEWFPEWKLGLRALWWRAARLASLRRGFLVDDVRFLGDMGIGVYSRMWIGIKADWRAHHGRLVLFLGNKNTSPLISVQALILPPAHLKMELSLVPDIIPPRAQVQCPLEVVNLQPSRDVSVLDSFFIPYLRVRGVRPMALPEMANLLHSFGLMISQGLDPNPNNLVASTIFCSEKTHGMLCLVRIETDPADRTQLRMTLASGDPTLTFEMKEFIKEQLVSIPTVPLALPAPPAAPPTPQIPSSDPAAQLAAGTHPLSPLKRIQLNPSARAGGSKDQVSKEGLI